MEGSDECYNCRVCGLRLDDPSWGRDGHSSVYEYCPCCGVEFGYQDATPPGVRNYRNKWLERGAKWSEPAEQPADWNLDAQLKGLPDRFR